MSNKDVRVSNLDIARSVHSNPKKKTKEEETLVHVS